MSVADELQRRVQNEVLELTRSINDVVEKFPEGLITPPKSKKTRVYDPNADMVEKKTNQSGIDNLISQAADS